MTVFDADPSENGRRQPDNVKRCQGHCIDDIRRPNGVRSQYSRCHEEVTIRLARRYAPQQVSPHLNINPTVLARFPSDGPDIIPE